MPASITFVNSDTGFISGDIVNGNSSTGRVYKTMDGGRTWKKILQKGTAVSNVSVFGHDSWIDVTDQQNGGLYFSKDDGQTFNRISSMSLSGIDFWSRNVGWAVSQNSHFETVIMKTTDGGKQWLQVHLPSVNEQQLPSGGGTFINFTNPQNGLLLIAGQPAAGQQPKALLQTTDGGETWNSVFNTNTDAKSQRNQLIGGYANGIDAVPSHPSYAYLWESRGPLLYTSDGGKSWHESAVTKPTVIEGRGVSLRTVNDVFVVLHVTVDYIFATV